MRNIRLAVPRGRGIDGPRQIAVIQRERERHGRNHHYADRSTGGAANAIRHNDDVAAAVARLSGADRKHAQRCAGNIVPPSAPLVSEWAAAGGGSGERKWLTAQHNRIGWNDAGDRWWRSGGVVNDQREVLVERCAIVRNAIGVNVRGG